MTRCDSELNDFLEDSAIKLTIKDSSFKAVEFSVLKEPETSILLTPFAAPAAVGWGKIAWAIIQGMLQWVGGRAISGAFPDGKDLLRAMVEEVAARFEILIKERDLRYANDQLIAVKRLVAEYQIASKSPDRLEAATTEGLAVLSEMQRLELPAIGAYVVTGLTYIVILQERITAFKSDGEKQNIIDRVEKSIIPHVDTMEKLARKLTDESVGQIYDWDTGIQTQWSFIDLETNEYFVGSPDRENAQKLRDAYVAEKFAKRYGEDFRVANASIEEMKKLVADIKAGNVPS